MFAAQGAFSEPGDPPRVLNADEEAAVADAWEAYVHAAERWLAPGGRLVAIFFLDPPSRGDGEAGPPFGATREEIRQLFGPKFALERESVPNRAYHERVGREWVVEFVRTC